MVRLFLAVLLLAARISMFRYMARRAYAGHGRHWAVTA